MERWCAALLCCALLAASADGRAPRPTAWIGSWGSAQMVVDGENALPAAQARAVTLRQVVRLSAGGDRVRVRLSNVFGTRPLAIGAAHLARSLAPGTVRTDAGMALRFAGRRDAVIAAGAEIYSDPVALRLPPGADVAISLYLPDAPTPQTGHPGARATSFVIPGEHVADMAPVAATPTTHWYALADIEVAGDGAGNGTIVVIGDSITDGYGVAPETNRRWPDILAERLRARAATRGIGVVNAGIGGNRMLRDGLGPNVLARFDRDVIARSGVRWAVVLAGVNDLGVLTREAPAAPADHDAIVAQVTAGYVQIAARAHAHGIRVIGGTVMPFAGNGYYHPGPATEADRQAINRFIRTSGTFDAVVDFDRIMRDPAHPDRLAPAYDSGDHLHPSPEGYRVMGEAVPLTLFTGARLSVATPGTPPPAPGAPAIALTFDDIPAHGPLPPGQTRIGVIRAITSALARAGAPAFGFLNGGFGQDDPQGAAGAVAAWRAAGLPLGNHTHGHVDLDKVGPAAFAADVVRNEAPLAAAAGDSDWHWFRYPFLAEGRTAAVRDAARADLKARGYRIAAVTMSFGDFLWNAPYAGCAARNDRGAVARLERRFLNDARIAATTARTQAAAQLGRDIPYVLLLHVGAFDAHMLPRLLDLYRTMGFRFVTLAAAQADPFYAAAIDPGRPGPAVSLAGGPPRLAGPGPSCPAG